MQTVFSKREVARRDIPVDILVHFRDNRNYWTVTADNKGLMYSTNLLATTREQEWVVRTEKGIKVRKGFFRVHNSGTLKDIHYYREPAYFCRAKAIIPKGTEYFGGEEETLTKSIIVFSSRISYLKYRIFHTL